MALMFHIYLTFYQSFFCRVDDYDIKNKLAFEVAHTGYQNQKENFCLLPLQQQQQQQHQIFSIKQVKMKRLNLKLLMKKKTCAWFLLKQKRKIVYNAKNISFEEEKKRWKKAELLNDLNRNDLQMKHIILNVNKIDK